MQIPKIFMSTLLTFVLLLTFVIPTFAQKRTPRKPAPKPAVTQALSFDSLLSVDSYKVYFEIRNVGQLISSTSVNEMIEPVLKLAAPPKEFKTAVKWLTAHADAVTTSRMMVATSRTAKNLPNVLIAVEFENAEEAAKVEPQLNEVLLKVLPPTKLEASPSPQTAVGVTPTASPVAGTTPTASPAAQTAEPVPNFYVSRSGALMFITSEPLVIKNLRPRNSKPLSEDANFRIAHDRFTSESVFAFVNIKAMDQEEKEQQEKLVAEREALDAAAEEAAKLRAQMPEQPQPNAEPSPDPEPDPSSVDTFTMTEEVKTTAPDGLSIAFGEIASRFFGGFMEAKWPEAIAFGGNLDASSFDVKALLVTAPGEKSSVIPFFPSLLPGPSLVPESPSILPSNTELFVTMSLDLPQVYAVLSRPTPGMFNNKAGEPAGDTGSETPLAFIEKKAGIKFQDDVLPLIGNEIVFSMPLQSESTSPTAAATPTPESSTIVVAPSAGGGSATGVVMSVKTPTPIIGLSLKDKEGMRRILPKLIDGLGFKGASAFAQTEKREDTEIVNYAGSLAYAFIGNFLVLSSDVTNIKHVVDSYLKRETLASDVNFKNFTRWQPRQLQGQVYISPALMESYKSLLNEPTLMSDQTRDVFMKLSLIPEPVTYSLSNEGNGPLHQLRIPKNLLLMAVAGFSAESNQPPMVTNERSASGSLYFIAHLENSAKSEKGSYVSLEELVAQKKFPKEMLESNGYRITVSMVGEGFEATAVPIEYGKTGRMSFFINETMILRGGDHGGGPATLSDRPLQ